MERNGARNRRGDSPLTAAGEARRQRRRSRSRKKKRSARVTAFLEDFGWVVLATAVGVPMLAAVLYLASH